MADPREALDRRTLLRGGALAALGSALGACPGEDLPPRLDAGRDVPGDTGPDPAADLATLQGLLLTEHGAIKTYDAGLAVLASATVEDPLGLAPVILPIARRWQAQHRDHVLALSEVVVAAGGTPVAPPPGAFTPPAGFRAATVDVMKLAANAEKAAAVEYNRAVRALGGAAARFLAGAIGGDDAQHFVVLYALLKQVVGGGPELASRIDAVVPVSFVADVGGGRRGLQAVADLVFVP